MEKNTTDEGVAPEGGTKKKKKKSKKDAKDVKEEASVNQEIPQENLSEATTEEISTETRVNQGAEVPTEPVAEPIAPEILAKVEEMQELQKPLQDAPKPETADETSAQNTKASNCTTDPPAPLVEASFSWLQFTPAPSLKQPTSPTEAPNEQQTNTVSTAVESTQTEDNTQQQPQKADTEDVFVQTDVGVVDDVDDRVRRDDETDRRTAEAVEAVLARLERVVQVIDPLFTSSTVDWIVQALKETFAEIGSEEGATQAIDALRSKISEKDDVLPLYSGTDLAEALQSQEKELDEAMKDFYLKREEEYRSQRVQLELGNENLRAQLLLEQSKHRTMSELLKKHQTQTQDLKNLIEIMGSRNVEVTNEAKKLFKKGGKELQNDLTAFESDDKRFVKDVEDRYMEIEGLEAEIAALSSKVFCELQTSGSDDGEDVAANRKDRDVIKAHAATPPNNDLSKQPNRPQADSTTQQAQSDSSATNSVSAPTEVNTSRPATSDQPIVSDDAFAKGYMKNLIMRYMIYQARGNENEARVVRRAIFDFLLASEPERTQVENALAQATSGIGKFSLFKF